MTILEVPWLDASIAMAMIGSLWISHVRDPFHAAGWAWSSPAAVFVSTFLAWLGFYVGVDAIRSAAPAFSPISSAARFSFWMS